MAQSSDEAPPSFRLPTTIPTPGATPIFHAPLDDLVQGKWYMLRSSNNFWKDKRNINIKYTQSGSYFEDEAQYQTLTGDAIKSVLGRDTPSKDEIGVYHWQGKGLMRIATDKWEVLAYTRRAEKGDWMLVYAHGSIFASPAIHLMCKGKEGLSEKDVKEVEEWLGKVEDSKFSQAVKGMVDIKQE